MTWSCIEMGNDQTLLALSQRQSSIVLREASRASLPLQLLRKTPNLSPLPIILKVMLRIWTPCCGWPCVGSGLFQCVLSLKEEGSFLGEFSAGRGVDVLGGHCC